MTSGFLLAFAGFPLLLLDGEGISLSHWVSRSSVALGLAVLFLVSGTILPRSPLWGRILTTIAAVGTVVLSITEQLDAPATTLAILVAATGSLAVLWRIVTPFAASFYLRRQSLFHGQLRGASFAFLVLWFGGIVVGGDRVPSSTWVGVSSGAAVVVILALAWAFRFRRARPWVAGWLAFGALSVVGLASAPATTFGAALSVAAILAFVTIFVVRPERPPHLSRIHEWDAFLAHPERILVGTFFVLSVVGACFLALPQSSASGSTIGLVDAAFTSVSAVCVTGLIVVDTPHAFSGFGLAVILVLIQVGGIGIMTFSTAALWVFGRRLSLRHEGVAASLLSAQDRAQVFQAARRVLVLTFGVEAAGAVLLSIAFALAGDPAGTAIWRGVFTSVSAFCNAGFALQTQSLIPYQSSPVILHTVALLIVLGGLSPIVVLALPRVFGRGRRPVTAQVKLGLLMTVILLGVGFTLFLAFEWSRTLGGLSIVDRLHNAWFQSVTLRTAGFNSVDFAQLRPVTSTLMIVLMFIGGNPGGTAGGVKTTTTAILLLSMVSAVRRRSRVEAFGRTISEATRFRATIVVTLAALSAVLALLALQATQAMPAEWAWFEVASALGTVGLSIGGTTRLDGVGKVIIMTAMFVGRVGGLTLLMFLSRRRATDSGQGPAEDVDVG